MNRAFVFITGEGDGSDFQMKRTVHYGDNTLIAFGVNTFEQALTACKILSFEEDCDLIELCGAFERKGAEIVKGLVSDRTKVAYTVHSPEATSRLPILDGAKEVVSTYLFLMNEADGKVHVDFDHGTEVLKLIGVYSGQEALDVSRQVVRDGSILIEVDSDLGEAVAAAITEAIGRIPVGHVIMLDDQASSSGVDK